VKRKLNFIKPSKMKLTPADQKAPPLPVDAPKKTPPTLTQSLIMKRKVLDNLVADDIISEAEKEKMLRQYLQTMRSKERIKQQSSPLTPCTLNERFSRGVDLKKRRIDLSSEGIFLPRQQIPVSKGEEKATKPLPLGDSNGGKQQVGEDVARRKVKLGKDKNGEKEENIVDLRQSSNTAIKCV
jgi:hypothetical protein